MALTESDAAELRELQRRAYGREVALSPAEHVRLEELQAARVAPSAPDSPRTPDVRDVPAREPEASAADTAARPSIEDDRASIAGDGSEAEREHDGTTAVVPSSSPASPGVRGILRQHWMLVVSAAAVLLIVGLGAGWALFGGGDDAVALTPAQQERRAELQATGKYDEGTVRVLGQDDDALVWYAARDGGEQGCIILDAGGRSAESCQLVEAFDGGTGFGMGVSLIDTSDGDDGVQVSASAARATSGELVAIIQRWDMGPSSWLVQFAGEERDRAEELVDEGFEPYSFSIVGYFRGSPVWFGTRYDEFTPEECLVIDAVAATQCTSPDHARSSDGGITVTGVAIADDGSTERQWSVRLGFTPSGNTYLTITGDDPSSVSASAPSASAPPYLELGGEHGDPIRVELPSDDPDE